MTRPMGVTKLGNEYAEAVGRDEYAAIPKAVWAAIAVSFATSGGDHLDNALALVLHEWDTLHAQGIVPQAVPAKFRSRVEGVAE